jgi:hypothetical protein
MWGGFLQRLRILDDEIEVTLEDMLCRYLEESEECVYLSFLSVGRILLGKVPATTVSSPCQFYVNGKKETF